MDDFGYMGTKAVLEEIYAQAHDIKRAMFRIRVLGNACDCAEIQNKLESIIKSSETASRLVEE